MTPLYVHIKDFELFEAPKSRVMTTLMRAKSEHLKHKCDQNLSSK